MIFYLETVLSNFEELVVHQGVEVKARNVRDSGQANVFHNDFEDTLDRSQDHDHSDLNKK